MLVGSKVCLTPFVQADAPFLFAWQNDAALARLNGLCRPLDQNKFNEWFNPIGKDPSRVVFALRRLGDPRLLGYVQIINIQTPSRSAELGLLIGEPTDRDQGLGQEAAGLALDFCWRELNLQRVSLAVVGDNPRAIKTYRKAGFEAEGVLRRAAFVDGAFRDITIMAVLRGDAEPPTGPA